MRAFIENLVTWFEGKKTIFGGVAMILAAAAGVWFGKLDPVSGLGLAGLGFSAIGLGDKANRHQAELLIALHGIQRVGQDVRNGQQATAANDLKQAAADLAPSLASDALNAVAPGIHIQATTAEELVAILQGLAPTTQFVAAPAQTSLNSIVSTVDRVTQNRGAATESGLRS